MKLECISAETETTLREWCLLITSLCCVQVWEMSEHGWSALQYDQDGHSMCGFKMKFDSVIKLQIGEVYLNNIVYSERPDHQR